MQRKKTEMEAHFAAAIPLKMRSGSQFVFRQGSPLNSADLSFVAADDAATIMVLSDSAACADASDSQVGLLVLAVFAGHRYLSGAQGALTPSSWNGVGGPRLLMCMVCLLSRCISMICCF
jgi:hypothetical protein